MSDVIVSSRAQAELPLISWRRECRETLSTAWAKDESIRFGDPVDCRRSARGKSRRRDPARLLLTRISEFGSPNRARPDLGVKKERDRKSSKAAANSKYPAALRLDLHLGFYSVGWLTAGQAMG
jgi:hypothetical protein